ncbi:MAG: lipopolysaccharide heptosyltransferase II, partial [Candidatus Omnitrophica bacterium]|nr:lipopolysaccharide heptosyltransferase II [Candidatus Omnitrophota bacterium]
IIEDGRNGVLVYPKDAESLAGGILKVARDRQFAHGIAKEARRVVERKFTLQKMCEDTFAIYSEAMERRNILIIKLSAIGDVILSIPSIRAIREKFPGANIKVLVGVKSRNSLKGCPYVNDLVVCDFDGKDRGLLGFVRLAAELRRYDFDIVVDLQNNRKSHLLAFLSFAKLRFGYSNSKLGFLLNRGIKDARRPIGPVEHQFRVLGMLGIEADLGRDTRAARLELWPSKEDESYISDFLSSHWVGQGQMLVGVNMGASERWATKRWPINNIAKLCDELSKQLGARVVITGLRGDINAARRLSSLTRSRPIIACGKTNITQLAALVRRCRVFVSGDSAPLHVATAVGVPFVALFGPTDPRRHLVSLENGVVINKDLRCAPCYKPRCILNYRCMKRISVEEVLEAVRGLIAK